MNFWLLESDKDIEMPEEVSPASTSGTSSARSSFSMKRSENLMDSI